jgi:hypothetical protein
MSEPVSVANCPPGCSKHALVSETGGDAVVLGRLTATTQACPKAGGCGRPDTVVAIRYPTSGLNLPGEHPQVGELRWCSVDGLVEQKLTEPTQAEIAGGWSPLGGNVC